MQPIPKTPTAWSDEMSQIYQLCYSCMLFNNNVKHPICLIGGCEAAVINEQLINAQIDEYDRIGDDAEALKENEDE